MKKTLVALTVAALAATSANAAVVYNQDGSKVEVNGSLRVFLHKANKIRTDLKNDGSRLIVKGSHDLGNGLSAFGTLQLRFDDTTSLNEFGEPKTKQAFAGFKYDGVGALSLGVQPTNADDVQLGDYAYTLGGNNNLTTSGNAAKFRSAEWGGFSFGTDYVFGNADKKATGYKRGYGVAAFYNAEFGGIGLAFNAGYTADTNQDTGKNSSTNKQARLASEVTFGPVALAANYGFGTEKDLVKDTKTKKKSALIGAKYQVIEPTAVYTQFTYDKTKETTKTTTDKKYLVGADYQFSKNVAAFVEYARTTTKEKGGDKAKNYEGGLGVRISF